MTVKNHQSMLTRREQDLNLCGRTHVISSHTPVKVRHADDKQGRVPNLNHSGIASPDLDSSRVYRYMQNSDIRAFLHIPQIPLNSPVFEFDRIDIIICLRITSEISKHYCIREQKYTIWHTIQALYTSHWQRLQKLRIQSKAILGCAGKRAYGRVFAYHDKLYRLTRGALKVVSRGGVGEWAQSARREPIS